MSHSSSNSAGAVALSKADIYAKVDADLDGFFDKYKGLDLIACMATLNAFLKRAFPDWHFVGYYMARNETKDTVIGPYQGDVLATAIIPFGKGQVGSCAQLEMTIIQEDVSVCANYIPCDDVTRSEIVVPVFSKPDAETGKKTLLAVLDIDSPVLACFDDADKEHLERLLAKYLAL